MAAAARAHSLQLAGWLPPRLKTAGCAKRLGAVTNGRRQRIRKIMGRMMAMEVTRRFLTTVQHTYDREKNWSKMYDVSSTEPAVRRGEYPLQDGFSFAPTA
ncbi:hypothetical protein KCP77_13330 [Salmonella enterica subsp. enterica]|nr:hypothetical protein KCP77_13330 [Salmonella enterica subsp. enterica]